MLSEAPITRLRFIDLATEVVDTLIRLTRALHLHSEAFFQGHHSVRFAAEKKP